MSSLAVDVRLPRSRTRSVKTRDSWRTNAAFTYATKAYDLPSSAATSESESRTAVKTQSHLLEGAAARIDQLVRKGAVTEVAAQNTFFAISAIVSDNSATPQVGLDGESGIETEWLVDGQSLVLNCDAQGSVVLWALDSTGGLTFRHEINARIIDHQTTILAREYLEQISKGVKNRVPSTR